MTISAFKRQDRTYTDRTAFFNHHGVLGQFFCDADIVGGGVAPCGLDLPHGLNRL